MSGSGLKRVRKAVLALACVSAVFAVSAPAPAVAEKPRSKTSLAGRLDLSFGKGGKVTVAFPAQSAGNVGVKYELPFQFSPGHIEMAPAPGGKIVVAGSTRVVRFLPNGKLDRGFGSSGLAAVPALPGMTFVLASVAVDSQGRVLVGGSARPLPSSSTPDPLMSSAAVMRFGADGSLDPGFGGGGVLVSDLGIEPPTVPSGPYPGPAIGLRSIVVDSQDRPLLTGGFVSKVGYACGVSGEAATSTGFVARLTASGVLDSGFAEGGLRQISDLTSFGQAELTSSGSLFAVGHGKPSRCNNEGGSPAVLLTRFNEQGNPDPGFGFSGFRSVGFARSPVAAVLPSGKIALLGAKENGVQRIARLLPNGAPDPSFGRIGRVNVQLSKNASLAAIGADRRGRILLAGRVSRRVSKSPNNPLRRSTFALTRMTPEGNFDRSFGRKAVVRTGFGGPSSSFATQVMVDAKGRIVVGGGISTPRLGTGGGFAIARYLPGR